mgnify:CR=1 FL=1
MVYRLRHAICLLSNFCTSSQLLQDVALPNSASGQNQSPRLRANHLAESSRCGILRKTHSCSILCLATICFPSFLILRGRTGNAEYFRVRILDMKVFADQSRIITLALCHLIINPCCQDSTGSQKHSSLTHLLHCKAVLWHLL